LEGFSESLRFEVRPFDIHVSLVEPGGVKTPAADQVPNTMRAMPDYAGSRQKITANFNHLMREGMPPERVAKTILKIIESRSPRLRYRVGWQANLAWWMRSVLPQAALETAQRRFFGLGS
jgi:short-subunit dehydrogenase